MCGGTLTPTAGPLQHGAAEPCPPVGLVTAQDRRMPGIGKGLCVPTDVGKLQGLKLRNTEARVGGNGETQTQFKLPSSVRVHSTVNIVPAL